MAAILRHPRFTDPVPGYLAEAEALDRAEEREQCMVWQIKAARRRAAMVAAMKFVGAAVGLALAAGVVVALWLVKAWG